MPGYKITDIRCLLADVLPLNFHRVFGKVNNGMIEKKILSLIDPDGNTGQISNHPANISQIYAFHATPSNPLPW